jgi:hypothetical protein
MVKEGWKSLHVQSGGGPEPLGDGVGLLGGRRIVARFEWPALGGVLELTAEVRDKRARVVSLHIDEEPTNSHGLTGVTLAEIPLQRLLEVAMYGAGPMVARGRGKLAAATTDEDASRVERAVQRAARRRTSDDRLVAVSDAYGDGKNVAAQRVAEQLGVTERQAFRLIKQAKDAGFIQEDRS